MTEVIIFAFVNFIVLLTLLIKKHKATWYNELEFFDFVMLLIVALLATMILPVTYFVCGLWLIYKKLIARDNR